MAKRVYSSLSPRLLMSAPRLTIALLVVFFILATITLISQGLSGPVEPPIPIPQPSPQPLEEPGSPGF